MRHVLHIDLDSFFISVERLKNPKLMGLPVIVGGTSGRGVVASCSYETRRFGVHSAMPMRMALKLCPDAIVVRGDMEDYSNYSRLITEIIAEEAPLYEKASIDEFYLDLTGMDRFFGTAQWSAELRQKIIKESGLPLSWGLSKNKLISKIGTGEAKPNGTLYVQPSTEQPFIDPMPVRKIPMIGQSTALQLGRMGAKQVIQLRQIPIKYLEREFGEHGKLIWERANTIDDRPVVPYVEEKSIGTERTFQEDTIDHHKLREILRGMGEKLAFQLRDRQKVCSVVTVKIRYSDFNTYTKQRRIPYTASDKLLLKTIEELFQIAYDRRQLVRLVGVRLSGLVSGYGQLSLFDRTDEEAGLLQAMDKIRSRFGESAVGRAAGFKANPGKPHLPAKGGVR